MLMTDGQIGEKLGRDLDSISQFRDRNDLKKRGKRKLSAKGAEDKSLKEGEVKRIEIRDMQLGSADDKKLIVMARLENSAFGKEVLATLSPEDRAILDNQIAQYIEYSSDLTAPELQHLYVLILEMIHMVKIQKMRKNNSDTDIESALLYDDAWDKSVKRFRDLSRDLKVTRDQRLKKVDSSEVNVIKLVQAMQNERTRREAGEEAALYKFASEEWIRSATQKGIIKS